MIIGFATYPVTQNGQEFTVPTPSITYGESILTVFIVKLKPDPKPDPKPDSNDQSRPKEEPVSNENGDNEKIDLADKIEQEPKNTSSQKNDSGLEPSDNNQKVVEGLQAVEGYGEQLDKPGEHEEKQIQNEENRVENNERIIVKDSKVKYIVVLTLVVMLVGILAYVLVNNKHRR